MQLHTLLPSDLTIINVIFLHCPSSADDVKLMEAKVKEMAKQDDYKQKLLDGYQQVTVECLTEVSLTMPYHRFRILMRVSTLHP